MSPTSVFRAGANALITGGASGVGLAVAKLCASHSMNLILVDNNKDNLHKVKQELSASSKSQISIHDLDVSSESAWKELKQSLSKSSTTLDFLHLNAGIGLKGSWTETSYFHRIFDVNFFGVLNGIATFLPDFEGAKEQKAIVITGSKQGITNPPGNPAYNASKSAIKTIAEHLSFDLAKSSPNTSVHLLVPGWTFTGLTGGGQTKTKPDGAWAPEQVADFLYKKMGEGKFYAICPDNDVDWETDKKRMMWTMGDIVYERQPQSRWRDEYKDEAKKTMDGMKL
ncbi:NAD(P)-binding protein [Myriangium duriaei CBS 260.36]|uniref:NAD(P)-binding protein n=1 Tax=Myriangium duriaei CBS 260.36 TaxID=1168546 RepID=A0A9P4MHV3_9PEZI|nr:NAD(P)-binding protein [Myriangium duriaei CBS 260.36]